MAYEYDSAARRRPVVDEFLEALRYRDLLRLLISTGIKTRYKRSVLGIVWTLLNPLLTTLVLTVAFSALFRATAPRYPVYLLAGLVLWNFFSQSTTTAMRSLVWGGALLGKIYFPRTVFSLSAVGNGLVNAGLAMIPLVIVMAVLGQPLRLALLFVPAALLLAAAFTLGVALLLSTLAVYFVDVVDIYGIVLSAWFYMTPVIYPTEIFPAELAWLLRLNPMYSLIELFRSPIYLGQMPEAGTIAAACAWAVASLSLGWWVFARKSDEFVYRL
jgi:ABC-type polysaccharide/polyol phosphate export permease